MKIERTATGLIIRNADPVIKRKVLQYFSLSNPIREYFIYSGNDPTRKPLFGTDYDVIYISSGFLNINDNVVRMLPKPSLIQPPMPDKITLNMNREPRSKLQEDCINKMITSNQIFNKITLELKPGVELIPAPAYGDVRVKYSPLNCWDDDSNARCATT